MVYKKYVTRGGKKFGPYYFKSVREKDGRVRSVYLGTEDPSRKNLSFFGIFFLVALLFLVGFLGMFAYQGFQVAEISVESSEDVSDSVEEDIVDEEIIEEEIVEEESEVEKPIEEAIIEEEQDVIDEEINETEDEELEGDIEINETGVNETEDEIVGDNESIEINETGIDLNESESNVSEEDSEIEADGVGGIIVNGTNETKVNLSEPINESLNITKEENQTFLDPINESYETTLNNSGVVINQPVRWEKRIKLKERKEIYNVDLPEDAFDVEFYEVIEDEVIIESGENAGNLITGNIVFDFFKNIFSFTGKVTYEINDETIVIRNTPKEFLIEYSTPGPTSKEIELNQYSKKVVVNGEKFDDVLAYTHLNNSLSGGVSLYLLQDGKREKWNFKNDT